MSNNLSNDENNIVKKIDKAFIEDKKVRSRTKYKEEQVTSKLANFAKYAGGGIFQTVEFAVKACNQANTLDSDVLAEYVRHNVITTTLYDAILDDRGANILCRYTAVQYKDGIPKTLWPLDIAEAKAVFRQKR